MSTIPLEATVPHFIGDRQISTVAKPVPQPGPGQLLIEVKANALCGSERLLLAIYHYHLGEHNDHPGRYYPGQDAFGVRYARTMAVAVLAGFSMVAAYLIFQHTATEGIMITAGFKGGGCDEYISKQRGC
jgi:hypothetical protein